MAQRRSATCHLKLLSELGLNLETLLGFVRFVFRYTLELVARPHQGDYFMPEILRDVTDSEGSDSDYCGDEAFHEYLVATDDQARREAKEDKDSKGWC